MTTMAFGLGKPSQGQKCINKKNRIPSKHISNTSSEDFAISYHFIFDNLGIDSEELTQHCDKANLLHSLGLSKSRTSQDKKLIIMTDGLSTVVRVTICLFKMVGVAVIKMWEISLFAKHQ